MGAGAGCLVLVPGAWCWCQPTERTQHRAPSTRHRAPAPNTHHPTPSTRNGQYDFRMTSRRYLPAIFLLFIGSGCAALIYEIVWFQLLEMVIGSSAISLGILLGTFMGGMCVGSLLMPRLVS